MISAHRLIFNGFSTEDFDVVPYLSFDTDSGATQSYLNKEGVYTEHYDGHRTIHRAKYNEAFAPRFTLIKEDQSEFDTSENRKILSWLTASEKPGWLEVYEDDSNVLAWKIFGCVTGVEQYKFGNNRIIGYEFDVESSHPYAWSREFIYPEVRETLDELSINDEDNDYLQVNGTIDFTLTCSSDEYNKVVYPKVVIDFNGENIYFPVATKPLDNEDMISDVIYTFVEGNTQKYYVSISTEKIRTYVKSISKDVAASKNVLEENPSNYFYDKDTNVIKRIVGGGENPYAWENIVNVGAAVKINVSRVQNGETTSKEIIVKGAATGERVTLDGTNRVVSVLPDDDVRIIGDNFNWEWLPLAYGDNNITITGNCAVQIRWIEPRKVGSL